MSAALFRKIFLYSLSRVIYSQFSFKGAPPARGVNIICAGKVGVPHTPHLPSPSFFSTMRVGMDLPTNNQTLRQPLQSPPISLEVF